MSPTPSNTATASPTPSPSDSGSPTVTPTTGTGGSTDSPSANDTNTTAYDTFAEDTDGGTPDVTCGEHAPTPKTTNTSSVGPVERPSAGTRLRRAPSRHQWRSGPAA